MNRTALFRLMRGNRTVAPRPGIDLYLPKRNRDCDRLEQVLLGLAATLGYSLICWEWLRLFCPLVTAALLTFPALFVALQFLTCLLVGAQALGNKLGLRESPPSGDFNVSAHLVILTALALWGLQSMWRPLSVLWLTAVVCNLAAAIWIFVRPPWFSRR